MKIQELHAPGVPVASDILAAMELSAILASMGPVPQQGFRYLQDLNSAVSVGTPRLDARA